MLHNCAVRYISFHFRCFLFLLNICIHRYTCSITNITFSLEVKHLCIFQSIIWCNIGIFKKEKESYCTNALYLFIFFTYLVFVCKVPTRARDRCPRTLKKSHLKQILAREFLTVHKYFIWMPDSHWRKINFITFI